MSPAMGARPFATGVVAPCCSKVVFQSWSANTRVLRTHRAARPSPQSPDLLAATPFR